MREYVRKELEKVNWKRVWLVVMILYVTGIFAAVRIFWEIR